MRKLSGFLSVFLLALSFPLYPQPSGSTEIREKLQTLKNLLLTLESGNKSSMKDIESLQEAIANLENLLQTQGDMLNGLQEDLKAEREISARQSALLMKSLRTSKALKWSLIVSLPAAAGITAFITCRLNR